MTRNVSSERVSGELRDAIAAIIAGNVDESRFYNAPAFQRAATEVILALRSSVKTVGEFTLDEEEWDTILAVGRNEQSGRITNYELKELVRVYRAALEAPSPAAASEVTEAEKAKSEAIDGLLKADDVWEDYGSGFRIHFSFLPGSDMSVVERIHSARALTAALKGDRS